MARTQSWKSWGGKWCLVSWLAMSGALASGNGALSQSVPQPDTTLSSESSTVTSIGLVDQINGGWARGANLFHSFQEFNVDEGRTAVFTNPAGIENILTRVTGANPSNILGTLGVSGGNANLFLINPNGIIFGPNARLNIGGSFVGTTADAIGFANGEKFSANPAELLPNQLLNVNPNAFFFNQIAAQPVINRSTVGSAGLEVPQSKSLLLVGGDVRLEGGRLQAPGGRVELGGIVGTSPVTLNVNGTNLSLGFPSGVQLSDISLTNGAVVNVAGGGGGSIAVNARNIEVLEGSRLLAGIAEDLGTDGAQAGDITLNATGAITIGQSSRIFSSRIENNVNRNATGNSGNINIQAESLFMNDGAYLSTSAFGQGDAGSIFVRVSNAVNLIDNSYIDSTSAGFVPKVGDGGNIQIEAKSLSMNRARLVASTYRSRNSRDVGYGQGNGGSITVQVEGAVDLIDSSIDSFVGSSVVGNGGDIKIKAGSLFMNDEAILSTRTNGQGDAGDISVQVEGTVSLTTSNINSFVNFYGENYRAVGNGGDIQIKAGSLSMPANANISASTAGTGDAGNVSVQVQDDVSLSGNSYITSEVNTTAVGNGGNIQVETGSLSLNGDAVINTSTNGRGNAGNIQVNASNSVNISGVKPGSSSSSYSGLFTDSDKTATGQGGNISIATDALRISDRASLNARTNSAFRGGNITVDANTIEVTNGGKFVTTAFSSGEAGDINVNSTNSITISGSDPTFAGRFTARRVVSAEDGPASGLFAQSSATGNAGNLTITTEQLHVLDGAAVTVSGELGQAGNLTTIADSIVLDKGKLTAVTGKGEGGNITLQELDLLQMRDNSLISAEALGAANGGNIKLDTQFLVAVPSENSDIIANAVEGNGGNIDITAQGIFGIQYRDRLTLNTSDINASSEFGIDGTVELDTPDLDPSQGLVSLPTVPVDTEIAQACTPGGSQDGSEFIVTGRGGLPPNPTEALSSDAVQVDWVALDQKVDNGSSPVVSRNPTSSTPASIVEAQGWVTDNNGEVVLTASAPTTTPDSFWQIPSDCRTR